MVGLVQVLILTLAELMRSAKYSFAHYKEKHLFTDEVNYLAIIRFFTGFVRAEFELHPKDSPAVINVAAIRETFDFAELQRIMKFCDTYVAEKNWSALQIAFGALKEMVHFWKWLSSSQFCTVKAMTRCSSEENRVTAMRLQHNIFYHNIYTDKLAELLKTFDPTKQTKWFLPVYLL